MKQSSVILKNAGSNWALMAIESIISFFLSPFIIHKLGDSNYGIWILISSIIGYYGLLDLGIGSAVSRYVSKYHAVKDSRSSNEVMSSCFFIFLGIGIICLAVSSVFAFIMPGIFNVPQASRADFSLLVLILGLGIAITFPSKVFDTGIKAVEKFHVCNNIGIALAIAKTGFIVYLLSKGYGLVALGFITLGRIVLAALLYIRYAFKLLPGLEIKFGLVRKNQVKLVFNYSIFTFLIAVADHLRFYTDSLVIAYFLPIASITYYAIGAKLVEYFKGIIITVITPTTPVFSKYEATNRQADIQNLLIKATKYLALVSMFVGSILILYGRPFIRLWVGEKYSSSYFILLILVPPYISDLAQVPSVSALYGIDKHKLLAYFTLAEGMANLVLSLALVRKYGIYGVALGTAIPMFIVKTFIQPVYVCKIMKIPIRRYFQEALLKPFVIFLVFMSLMGLAIRFFPPGSFFQLGLMTTLSFSLFLAMVILFCVEAEEKMIWKQAIINKFQS